MIRDITIGQYYPAESPIHRLDARVKIVVTFLFIISLFVVNTFIGYVCVTAILGAVIKVSKVPLKFMLKGLKSIVIIILFTAVINLFLTQGEQVIWLPASDMGRHLHGCENVCASGTAHCGLLCADADHNTHPAHRRH